MTKPLQTIITLLQKHPQEITAWLKQQWQGLTPLPYFSCDIRHSSYKLGIVDTNVFPAGYNNLCNSFTHQTAQAFKNYFHTYYPQAKNIALLAETHTRNKYYLLNVLKLQNLITEAGFACRVTMPLEYFRDDPLRIELSEKEILEIYKPTVRTRRGDRPVAPTPSHYRTVAPSHRLQLGPDFTADLILANHDFSIGLPEMFIPLNDQIIPHPRMGWHSRSKSTHFKILKEIVTNFAQKFSFDPWIILPETETVTAVTPESLDTLVKTVDKMIASIQKKYTEYNIAETPYVFVKNDSGTYGLGQITASSGQEILALNRKKRGKLFATKGGRQAECFLVQEGIPTTDTYSDYPIEPVIYGVGKDSIAGFFRIHEDKNPYESLNAPGMTFSCLCLHKLDEPHEAEFIDCHSKEELVTGSLFLARLAALATAREMR